MRRAQQLAVPTIARARSNSTKASVRYVSEFTFQCDTYAECKTYSAPGKWALSPPGDVSRPPRASPTIQKWPSARPARLDDTRDSRPRSPSNSRASPSASSSSFLNELLRPVQKQPRRAGPADSSRSWNPSQEGPSKRPAYRAELRFRVSLCPHIGSY